MAKRKNDPRPQYVDNETFRKEAPAVFNRVRCSRPGMIDRDLFDWDMRSDVRRYPEGKPWHGFRILCVDDAGSVQGYAREVASWQLLSWVFRIGSLYFFLMAFHVHASIHNALLAQVVDSLSTLLPFSPGGVGTKQGLLVYVLNGQASSSQLLAFSVGQYVAVTLFNVIVGAIAVYAMLRTLRLREILGRAKAAKQSEEGTPS